MFLKNGDYLCTLDYQHLHGTRCNGCGDFVEGEVVTALGKTYHQTCFVCTICNLHFHVNWPRFVNCCTLLPLSSSKVGLCLSFPVCGCDLAQGGFFMKNGDYLCTLDYQHLHGTRCNGCGDFVEGEVVTALGKTYHQTCFVCTICK
ncbi:UNVERIFIED_CONTAM: hypothetical protein FKN15_024732 [Acipenser sinensis]